MHKDRLVTETDTTKGHEYKTYDTVTIYSYDRKNI